MTTSMQPCIQPYSSYESIMSEFNKQSFYSIDFYSNPNLKPNATYKLSSICMLMYSVSFMVVVILPGFMIVMMMILDPF